MAAITYGSPVAGPSGAVAFGEVEDYFLTPEPTSLVLLGSALLLLVRRRRRT